MKMDSDGADVEMASGNILSACESVSAANAMELAQMKVTEMKVLELEVSIGSLYDING